MMNYHVLTLFPEMIRQGLNTSIIGRAIESGCITLEAVNIRDYSHNKHGKVDDYPYGGGAGMVMQAEPVYAACEDVKRRIGRSARIIYVTPQGAVFHQTMAEELAKEEDLIFLCGHYEGIDERVLEEVVTDYVSIGDYVLTGGELPAMVMIDAISRLVPGVLNNEESAELESFHGNLLEYPQYSRPEQWHGKAVPPVLLSGNHPNIEGWRREHSIMRTRERRPDLYEIFCKSQEEEGNRAGTKKKLKAVILRLETCLCRDSAGELSLKPFLRELLGLVREQGLKLGLVSLMESEQAQKLLESEGVSQLFDYICFGADEETLYNRAARKSSTARRETFVFEDTVSGIQAARACGLRVVLLKEEEPGKEYADLICYKRISDLVEGMALIRSLS